MFHAIQDVHETLGNRCNKPDVFYGLMSHGYEPGGFVEGMATARMYVQENELKQRFPLLPPRLHNIDQDRPRHIIWTYPTDWELVSRLDPDLGYDNFGFYRLLYDRLRFTLGPERSDTIIFGSLPYIRTDRPVDKCPDFISPSNGTPSHYTAMLAADSLGHPSAALLWKVFKEFSDPGILPERTDELPGMFSGATLFKHSNGTTSVAPQSRLMNLESTQRRSDYDYFSFWTNSGEEYTVTLSASFNICLRAYSVSGDNLADEVYHYGLPLSDSPNHRRIAGSFETSTDVDDYLVSLNAGEVINVSAIPLSPFVDTVVEILSKIGAPWGKAYFSSTDDNSPYLWGCANAQDCRRRPMLKDDNGRTGWDRRGSELRFVAPDTADYVIRVYEKGTLTDCRFTAWVPNGHTGVGRKGEYELDVRWYPSHPEGLYSALE